MLAHYFIKVVIPTVFASFVAALGWFAFAYEGAVIGGVSAFVIAIVWSFYSWFTGHRANLLSRIRASRKFTLRKRLQLSTQS
jgi:hypothetical protein